MEPEGPVTTEVLRQAAEQEHPKHEASGREIGLLWERVNQIMDRLDSAIDISRHYRISLETGLDEIEDALLEHDNRLDSIGDALDAEPLPTRSFWDHFKGWG